MEDCFAALEQAFEMYRQDLDEYERKRKPTDGLLHYFAFRHRKGESDVFDYDLHFLFSIFYI